MKINLKKLSLQGKMSCIFILANTLVFLATILLFGEINSMSREMDMVFKDNMHLNELSDALTAVQDSMTDYLNAKTSDSLEEFYRNEQAYAGMIEELNDRIVGTAFLRMERSIRYMSQEYLEVVEQTIEAKRGRNVEKYRVRYENASQMYGYINTYINSLNSERFKNNSENYSRLSESFHRFEGISMLVLAVVVVGNIVVIIRITGSMIRPLKSLAVSADEVARGNFETGLLPVTSEDEIGIVTKAFNQMVISIRQYIERLRQSMEIQQSLKEKELMMEAHLKDAQLKYLQAQINPHFLFNSLNAGAQLAMMESADRTYDYIQNMAAFFRYNIKKDHDEVTLEEEIRLVDNYIYILNVRFSGEIHFEKKVDESLLGEHIPSMLLQPIVENSVNYGIRNIDWEGRIVLSVYREEGKVCISIKDNGVGMTEERIEQVMQNCISHQEDVGDSNGVGLNNVMERLHLFFDGAEEFVMMSEGPGRGTEVVIRIPYLKM